MQWGGVVNQERHLWARLCYPSPAALPPGWACGDLLFYSSRAQGTCLQSLAPLVAERPLMAELQ